MKYIYYVISIITIFSLIILFMFIEKKTDGNKETALKINDRLISRDEFNQLYNFRSDHLWDWQDFIQSLIGKELFIQEARKLGIDKEDQFRQALQNFYEQSLIKILMDRKENSLDVAVDDSLVNQYIGFLDKSIDFTFLEFDVLPDTEEQIEADLNEKGENRQAAFQDLSIELRSVMITLGEGETSKPIVDSRDVLSNRYFVTRINKIVRDPDLSIASPDRDQIRKLLEYQLKEQSLNEWIRSLRQNADIRVFLEEEK